MTKLDEHLSNKTQKLVSTTTNEETTTAFIDTEETNNCRRVSLLTSEEIDRGQWSKPLDFLMSMIAYAVGLG